MPETRTCDKSFWGLKKENMDKNCEAIAKVRLAANARAFDVVSSTAATAMAAGPRAAIKSATQAAYERA